MAPLGLKHRADLLTLAFIGSCYVAFTAAWLHAPTRGPAAVAVVAALSVMGFIAATVVHNAIHAPIFRARWANKLFQLALSFAFGWSVSGFVPGHNLSHHRHLGTAKDIVRSSKARFRCNLLNQSLFFFVMIPGIARSESRFVAHVARERRSWWWQYKVESFALIAVYTALFLLDWERFALFRLLPYLWAVWGISGANFWQHDGCDPTHPYNHSRSITGTTFNLLTFNYGFHGAHHEMPGLHWSHLPSFHAERFHGRVHPNLEHRSLLAYLWSAHVWPGRRVDYLGRPVVLPPAEPDEDWVLERRAEAFPAEDLGAEGE